MARCLERIRPQLSSEREQRSPPHCTAGLPEALQGGPAPLGKKQTHPSFLRKPRFSQNVLLCGSVRLSRWSPSRLHMNRFLQRDLPSGCTSESRAQTQLEKKETPIGKKARSKSGPLWGSTRGTPLPNLCSAPLRAWLPTPLPARGHQSGLLALPRPGPRGRSGIGAGLRVLGRPPAPRRARWGTAAAPRLPSSADYWCRRRAPGPQSFSAPADCNRRAEWKRKGLENWYLASTAAAAAAASRRRSGRSGRLAAARGRVSREGPLSPADALRPELSSARAPQRNVVGVCSRVAEPGCGPEAQQGGGGRGSEGVRPCPGPRARPPSPAR